jgi:DNA-binding CsgD family transcriptional regulator
MYQEASLENKFSGAFCESSQEFAWVRDSNFRFKHVTNHAAKLSGFKSFEQLLGLTAYEINAPIVQSAPEFDRQLNAVVLNRQPLEAIDVHTLSNGNVEVFTTKLMPVYNDAGNVTAVFGKCQSYSRDIVTALVKKLIPAYESHAKFVANISQSMELIDVYPIWNLTRRESECLYYLMRGRSNKLISQILNISVRTVDSHVESLKIKADVLLRGDLIDLSLLHGLLRFIPKSLAKLAF